MWWQCFKEFQDSRLGMRPIVIFLIDSFTQGPIMRPLSHSNVDLVMSAPTFGSSIKCS